MTKKNLHLGGHKKKIINLVEFSKQSLHLKNYSNSFSLLKNKEEPYLLLFEGEKTHIRRNKFASENFFVCACVFLKQKRYIFSYTFDLCGQVGDEKISTRQDSGNSTTFFWPKFF